jgi:hypothetical protein
MIFGFIFLVAGLLVQALDVSRLPFLRKDPDVNIVAIGGGTEEVTVLEEDHSESIQSCA